MKKLLNHKSILIYFQDQGSSDYLINAIQNYNFNKFKLIFVVNENVRKFIKRQIKYNNFLFKNSKVYYVRKKTKKYFINLLIKNKINYIISTCSSNLLDTTNEKLFDACIQFNKSINIFIDHWKGSHRLNNYKNSSSFFNIGVIDKDQKKIYSQIMKNSKISITGHPVLQKIDCFNKRVNKKILLISQPLIGKKFISCFAFKKNNHSILHNIISYLIKNYEKYSIYYRPHPKEKLNKETTDKCIIDKSNDNISIKKFNIYIGFNSIFLYKASLAGANVIQLSKNFNVFKDFSFKKKYNFNKNIIDKNIFLNSEKKCHKFLDGNLI